MKTALVTGGSRGIGLAIALELGRSGYAVAIMATKPESAYPQSTQKLREAGVSYSWHAGNIANTEDRLRVVDEVAARHGRIDVLNVYCVKGNVKAEKFYKGTGAVYDGFEKRFYTGTETISNRFCWKSIGDFKSDVSLPGLQYDYQQIYEYINNDFALFGAGEGCREFMRQLGSVSMPTCIFDNNESLWGQNINGVPIRKPEKTDSKIILTSSNVAIRKQLKELGYQSDDVTEYYPWYKYVNN